MLQTCLPVGGIPFPAGIQREESKDKGDWPMLPAAASIKEPRAFYKGAGRGLLAVNQPSNFAYSK